MTRGPPLQGRPNYDIRSMRADGLTGLKGMSTGRWSRKLSSHWGSAMSSDPGRIGLRKGRGRAGRVAMLDSAGAAVWEGWLSTLRWAAFGFWPLAVNRWGFDQRNGVPMPRVCIPESQLLKVSSGVPRAKGDRVMLNPRTGRRG